jgi:hypothetical protein
MFRIIAWAFLVGAALLMPVKPDGTLVVERARIPASDKLDGVYEFVSELTVLTAPRKATQERRSSEWAGIWQLQDGHYTRVLMKRRRDRFFEPKKLDDLGFESFAGPYEIKGDSISLTQDYAFNPFTIGRSALFRYRSEGDTLTLIERLHPYMEDLREGTITIVLRKVK